MNDDRDDLLDLRASAYLDGDLDGDDRAAVEGGPALVERAAQLRVARDAVGDVGGAAPASPVVRERLVAAALDAFDDLHAAPDAAAAMIPAGAPPRPAHRFATGRTRWLGAVAAAAVVAAGIGAVVATVANRDDDDSSAITDAAVVATDDEAGARIESSEEPAAADSATEMAAPTSEAPAAGGATAPMATTPASLLEATEATEAAEATTLAPTVQTVVGEDELAELARRAEEDAASGGTGVPEPACDDDRFARAIAVVDYSTDPSGPAVRGVAVLDPAAETVYVVVPDTCDVVAEAQVDASD